MSVLKEQDCIEKLESYTVKDWKPLLDLIPEIEKIEKFCEISTSVEDGVHEMRQFVEHEIIQQFRDVVYSIPIAIDFYWVSWQEGRKMASDINFNYDSVDIPTKCKIISAIVRNDRYCDGALVDAFESGLMLKVLKSIQRQL